MSHAAAAMNSAPETKWTVVSGPMKGVVRLMSQAQFYIGRSTECEFVVVNDPKCSRKHAMIIAANGACEVISQNDKNLCLVNGKEVERKTLRDGDIVTLGETEVQYNATARRMDPVHMAVVRQQPHGNYVAGGHPAQVQQPARRRPGKKSASPRLLIYFILAIFALFLFTPSKTKKKTIDIRTSEQIDKDIEAAKQMEEAAAADSTKRNDKSVTAVQAQEHYVRGIRDLRKGQFERGLVSFQACLALDPAHSLCNHNIRLARRRLDELIQLRMRSGKEYRDRGQYRSCLSAFKDVMVWTVDKNNPVFREAKANYDACFALVEGRF